MQRRSQLALIIATIVSTFTLAVVPVAAEGGTSGGDTTSGDKTTQSTTETETNTSQVPESVRDKISEFREKAKEELATQRDDHQKTTEEHRQKACEARAANLNRRASNYAAAAARHLAVFDGIFAKVQAFYTNKGLNVTGYDALVATAKDKQAAAQAAVDVLKGLDVNIDCTQSDPAQTVQALKTAVKNAREALQAYRSAIKDVIVAIKGASSAQEDNGGNQ